MSHRLRLFAASVLCLAFALALIPSWRRGDAAPQANASAADAREQAYRANNLGVSLLEQFKHREGAEQFRRALKLYPQLALARINLAIALLYVPDALSARKEALAAAALAPEAPQPYYVLGLLSKSENKPEEALAAFQRVLKIDPRDVGANVQTGQLYAQQRKYTEAVASFRAALAEEPYNGTALYNLGTALLRAGQREEGQRLMAQFQSLRQSGAATVIGQNYFEQGRYAEAVSSTGAEPDLVNKSTPEVVFNDATSSVMPNSTTAWPFKSNLLEQSDGGALLFDYDGDGDLDLLEVASVSQRLYRNDAGKFADVTAQAGALAKEAAGISMGAVAGDFDNDGRADLFILRHNASALYRNEGGGRFADATANAKIPAYPYRPTSAAFVDYDHDGDLDLYIAGGDEPSDTLKSEKSLRENPPNSLYTISISSPAAPSLLLRNNGDGTFSDQTAASKLSGKIEASAVVPTDYDNRRDVDLLVASNGGVALWRNMRDGSFRDVTRDVGLGVDELKGSSSLAAADVNKDGFTDFYFGKGGWAGYFAMSDGKGRFQLKRGPGQLVVEPNSKAAYYDNATQLVDYDNDGLLDLVSAVTTSKDSVRMELRVWRNTGDGWTDVSEKATAGLSAAITPVDKPGSGARVLASGDVDGDGDTDLIFGVPGGGLKFARNDGGNRNASVRVRLAGKVSNRTGVGAKIELRAGSLQQKLETYSATPAPAPADVNFGIGRRASADAVRVIWPSGVVQSETEIAATAAGDTKGAVAAASTTVTELDRKPSSCPYLYTWNGSRFEFITDFMGGGEMGDWVAPGLFNTPDPDEYVRIRDDQLKERGGRYELRVTNELEEALFVDRLQLVSVAHPAGVEVYPNEGLGNPTNADFKLYATHGARPPRTAQDEHGHDVLQRLERLDRKYVDDFALLPVRGYAEEHTLTLDLNAEKRQDGETGRVGDGETKSKAEGGRRKAEGNADGRTAAPSSFILLLTGWTDYAFSSDNVAATQRGFEMKPPALQVRDMEGKWQTVVENIGIPVGRPQTVTVDLTGKFLSASREVRLVTNMRVYWDQILVDDSVADALLRVERLEASVATLRDRGFSASITLDGREPFGYDYARVSLSSPWKAFPGRYTRFGDVRELLRATDDMFVVSRPGDELALSFDARALRPLPTGWTRTFLLYADGFSKEMDINSASPHELAPLPFHGMKSYPYAAPENYPTDEAHRSYMERYNTRVVTRAVPRIEAALRP
jgi:tetratricopeptide (TPR) repeat protein